jgi:hypothetical protein
VFKEVAAVTTTREWEMSEFIRRLGWFAETQDQTEVEAMLMELKGKVIGHPSRSLSADLEGYIDRLELPRFLRPVIKTEVRRVLKLPHESLGRSVIKASMRGFGARRRAMG